MNPGSGARLNELYQQDEDKPREKEQLLDWGQAMAEDQSEEEELLMSEAED